MSAEKNVARILSLGLLGWVLTIGAATAQQTTATPTAAQVALSQYKASHRRCTTRSDKCHTVCEAANRLVDAAQELLACASRHDYSEDCSSASIDARDAHDQYESAVSDADGDCH